MFRHLEWTVRFVPVQLECWTCTSRLGGTYGFTSGRFTVYADPVTQHIAKKGGMVRMSVLFDYKAVQKLNSFSYLSMRAQQQFDCKEELSRRLASSLFAGN